MLGGMMRLSMPQRLFKTHKKPVINVRLIEMLLTLTVGWCVSAWWGSL